MNLVSFALRRPISLLMGIVATALMGFLALDRMARDIFPDLGVERWRPPQSTETECEREQLTSRRSYHSIVRRARKLFL
jgi:hypothetical protein